MSFQTEVDAETVGIEVQKFVDQASHTELILSDLDNGFWRITADSKQFWTHAATPGEAQKMHEEIAALQTKLSEAVELLRSSIEWCEVCDGTGFIDGLSVDDINFLGESDKPCPACREPIVNFLASIETKGDDK